MHRRDYVLIAKVIKRIAEKEIIFSKEQILYITEEFIISLKKENSSFNETKFRDYIKKGE